ncbi:non-hydrolyzing UDP-N-acetylglucosamine 2-epimerase [uncultured Desulfobacter sp.]|uniref:non-hydrolyzing UDP-N-acetylglucosamine 2-epimerase n=1 Tax=uncultured Desulfobacter sp. TaxID=240139 RepID=UPI0029F5265C|nr:UDP-N-acetylglucosamine 2-epimerase (non-hydrolyzing) [uncultured Desulfobacter sp.]
MKILTVIGARPQFIKAATVSSVFAKHSAKGAASEILLHTGQHYDQNMSEIFFKELGIPKPKYNLGITAATHGSMTGRMLEQIEEVLLQEMPDCVIVYGDTNSTLAGALAASKLHIPVAHVEAGLRSFNRKMPEETNRVIVDHISDLLFVPTHTGVKNLKAEGIVTGVYHTGDVMYDAALLFGKVSDRKSEILKKLQIEGEQYYLATVHRAENTDQPERLRSILDALLFLNEEIPVVLPLHPRTAKIFDKLNLKDIVEKLYLTQPLSYLDMVALEKNAKAILTDSGGVQKEAYYHNIPCITLRDETEWTETVNAGWNAISGADFDKIISDVKNAKTGIPITEYGDGNASNNIVDILLGKGAIHQK